jgi:hypothetical protein
MNIFTNYIAYLKDNPKGYWFKRKLYGWGWTPARWQGWATIGVWILFLVAGEIWFIHRAEMDALTMPNIIFFVGYILVIIAVLIRICYKYGETPRWSWGNKK